MHVHEGQVTLRRRCVGRRTSTPEHRRVGRSGGRWSGRGGLIEPCAPRPPLQYAIHDAKLERLVGRHEIIALQCQSFPSKPSISTPNLLHCKRRTHTETLLRGGSLLARQSTVGSVQPRERVAYAQDLACVDGDVACLACCAARWFFPCQICASAHIWHGEEEKEGAGRTVDHDARVGQGVSLSRCAGREK